jgi:hypothetical protein
MNLLRTLKVLILCEIGLGLLNMFVYAISKHYLPAELQRFLVEHKRPLWSAGSWLSLIWLVLDILGWVGLWRLWRRGRAFYTAVCGVGAASTALMGPYVHSGPTEAIFGLSLIVTGLILGMIYLSDLRCRFGKSAAQMPRSAT